MSVTLTDLPALVRQLTPHICPDETLPVLHGIYLEATGNDLFACATDRFTFALARREAPETGQPIGWKAFLARTDLVALRALFPTRRRPADLTFTYEPPTVENPDGWLAISDGNRSLRLSANTPLATLFPKWRPLFADALAAEPQLTSETHLNPRMLARWAMATEPNVPVAIWSAGPRKPLLIAAGHDFLGLQMPVRLDKPSVMAPVRDRHDLAALRESWSDTLTAGSGSAQQLKAA